MATSTKKKPKAYPNGKCGPKCKGGHPVLPQTKTKMHLSRPTNERKTMCGRGRNVQETDQPRKVTCLTCSNLYERNKSWYGKMKRKLTASKKK